MRFSRTLSRAAETGRSLVRSLTERVDEREERVRQILSRLKQIQREESDLSDELFEIMHPNEDRDLSGSGQ